MSAGRIACVGYGRNDRALTVDDDTRRDSSETVDRVNEEARRQATSGVYDHTFDEVDKFMAYIDGLGE